MVFYLTFLNVSHAWWYLIRIDYMSKMADVLSEAGFANPS